MKDLILILKWLGYMLPGFAAQAVLVYFFNRGDMQQLAVVCISRRRNSLQHFDSGVRDRRHLYGMGRWSAPCD